MATTQIKSTKLRKQQRDDRTDQKDQREHQGIRLQWLFILLMEIKHSNKHRYQSQLIKKWYLKPIR